MELQNLKNNWITDFPHPFIIAGPCSAESEKQMLETAERIKKTEIIAPVFRAGIWKPRTKPNGFEGVGAIGLQWLQNVKEEFGFKTATEVATKHHVEAAFHRAQLPERDYRYLAGYSEYPVYRAGDYHHNGAAGRRGGDLPDRICRGEPHSGGDRIRG